jgi:type II secretory pathway pseudopilin PulG
MAMVSCPDCGAQVSDTAVVCPQCGFPLRRDVLARNPAGRASSGSNTAGIVIGVVAAGFVVVVVVGILAALAIPRFAMASARAREKEGEGLLKQAYTLENVYYANNGAWAPTLDELKSVGWEDPDSTRYYEVEIRLGPAPSSLCLEARVKRGADVQPLSMDSAGTLYHDAGCTGETVSEARASAYPPPAVEDVPGEGGEAGARTLLREIYLGVVEYRAEHGADPTELSQVLRHVHFTRATNENVIEVGRSGGRLCVSATAKSGGHALSFDREGRLYGGDACSGAVLEQLEAPADAPSAKPDTKTPS